MTQTVRDIITQALKKNGAIGSNETPSAEDIQDGFVALNNMINEWSAQSLMVRGSTLETFTLTANQANYTIGVGGNFNTVKPFEIISAQIVDDQNCTYDMQIIDMTTYRQMNDVLYNVDRPIAIAYDPMPSQQTVQTGNVWLYYTPDKAYGLKLETRKGFTEFTSLSQTVTFEPHYIRGIVYALACDMFYDFHDINTQIPIEMLKTRDKSMQIIRAQNSVKYLANIDVPGTKNTTYNIYTDGN